MKKIAFFTVILFVSLLCIHGVRTYNYALVENQAEVTISDPENGLVSFVPLHDQLCLSPGENKDALYVVNNLPIPISYSLEYDSDYFSLEQSVYGLLFPDESDNITLTAADNCSTGDFSLPIILQVEFAEGNARISADLAICVEESSLPLSSGDDRVTSSADGGDTDLGYGAMEETESGVVSGNAETPPEDGEEDLNAGMGSGEDTGEQ